MNFRRPFKRKIIRLWKPPTQWAWLVGVFCGIIFFDKCSMFNLNIFCSPLRFPFLSLFFSLLRPSVSPVLLLFYFALLLSWFLTLSQFYEDPNASSSGEWQFAEQTADIGNSSSSLFGGAPRRGETIVSNVPKKWQLFSWLFNNSHLMSNLIYLSNCGYSQREWNHIRV